MQLQSPNEGPFMRKLPASVTEEVKEGNRDVWTAIRSRALINEVVIRGGGHLHRIFFLLEKKTLKTYRHFLSPTEYINRPGIEIWLWSF